MSVALENIWDEPLDATPSRSKNYSVTAERGEEPGNGSDDEDIFPPSKRRKPTALFLDDPDEDDIAAFETLRKVKHPPLRCLFLHISFFSSPCLCCEERMMMTKFLFFCFVVVFWRVGITKLYGRGASR